MKLEVILSLRGTRHREKCLYFHGVTFVQLLGPNYYCELFAISDKSHVPWRGEVQKQKEKDEVFTSRYMPIYRNSKMRQGLTNIEMYH